MQGRRQTIGLPITTIGLPITTIGLPITTIGLPITTIGLPITTIGLPITTIGLPITTNGLQGWGQVLLAVLESSTSTFQICKYKYKYKYSQYLDGIKYIKYFFNQVQVQVPSTLVTNNSTVSLVPNSFTTITLVHTVTCKVKNTFQICTKITFILWNQPWIDKLCICHPIQLMDHMINHRRITCYRFNENFTDIIF